MSHETVYTVRSGEDLLLDVNSDVVTEIVNVVYTQSGHLLNHGGDWVYNRLSLQLDKGRALELLRKLKEVLGDE